MNLEAHYETLYKESIQKISNDIYQIDHLIDSASDHRFGITLLARPPESIKNDIQKFLGKLKAIEPNQYYYNNSDIHITVMSIISCYNGFKLEHIEVPEYIKHINNSIKGNHNIDINFKGITASPSCIMIPGLMRNESLNNIRNSLRKNFKNSTLEQSIDARYSIQTAHSTVVRFTKRLSKKLAFLDVIESYRDYNFGTFKIDTLELVYNDWYQKEKHVKKLFEFNI